MFNKWPMTAETLTGRFCLIVSIATLVLALAHSSTRDQQTQGDQVQQIWRLQTADFPSTNFSEALGSSGSMLDAIIVTACTVIVR